MSNWIIGILVILLVLIILVIPIIPVENCVKLFDINVACVIEHKSILELIIKNMRI